MKRKPLLVKDDIEYSARILPLLGKQSDASIKRDVPGPYSSWMIGCHRRELGIDKWRSFLTRAQRAENERIAIAKKKVQAKLLPALLRKFGTGKPMDEEMKAFLLEKDMAELERKYPCGSIS